MFKNKKFVIYLEITTICNLKCPFCPSSNQENHRSIAMDDMKLVLEKIKDRCELLYFHVLGEPSLHKDFKKILTLVNSLEIDFAITTNGTNLQAFDNDILNLKYFKKINISLQSYIQFDDVKKEKFLNELNTFLNKKNNVNESLPINLRLWNDKSKTDIINLNNQITFFLNNVANIDNLKNVRVSTADEFQWPTLDACENNIKSSCLGGKKQLAILNNGNVVLCCLDYLGHSKIGNIFEESLDEILDSFLYKKVIKGINDRTPYFEICKKCTYRNRFEK